MKSLNFRTKIHWICCWFFPHLVENRFAKKDAQIKRFFCNTDLVDGGLILGQLGNGIFPVERNLFFGWDLIKAILDGFYFSPNVADI